jgi:hypothetical protein
VLERRSMPPLGHFSLIRFGRRTASGNGQDTAAAERTGVRA